MRIVWKSLLLCTVLSPFFLIDPLTLTTPNAVAQGINPQVEQDRADQLYQQGKEQYDVGQYLAAQESWEAALEIYRSIGDRKSEGDTLTVLGFLFQIAGDPQTAIDYHQQALEIALEIDERAGEGNALGNLASVYNYQGQYQQAMSLYEQSLEIFREIGNRPGERSALAGLGEAYRTCLTSRLKALHGELFSQIRQIC